MGEVFALLIVLGISVAVGATFLVVMQLGAVVTVSICDTIFPNDDLGGGKTYKDNYKQLTKYQLKGEINEH